jgi:glycosyltransferase involved in cell wall biosynthesis
VGQSLAIVHVVRSPVGGIYRHIADLAIAQKQAGHRVGLICDSLTGGQLEEDRIAALAPDLALGVLRIPMPRAVGPGDLPATIRVARHIARLRADVVHAHGAKGGVFGRLAAMLERRRGRSVAAFYAPHGGSLHYEKGSTAGRVYFAIERALELATDALIHVSAYEAKVYREKVGVPRCPAHVVVNGLRPEEFEPVVPDANAVDFLYIGMLRDLKGIDVFLDALARLKERGCDVRANVVGAGDRADEQRYGEFVNSSGLADRVAFLPPMPARRAFSGARTVVVPSRAESMPYIVLEIAAAGLPLLATNVGGIPEVLWGEGEALLPPGDADALASAMELALASPERMAAEAMVRRERIRQKFSLATMAARIEDIYRDALERYRERRVGPAIGANISG